MVGRSRVRGEGRAHTLCARSPWRGLGRRTIIHEASDGRDLEQIDIKITPAAAESEEIFPRFRRRERRESPRVMTAAANVVENYTARTYIIHEHTHTYTNANYRLPG